MENNSEKDRYEPTVKMLRTNKLKNHRKLQNNSKFLIINGKYCWYSFFGHVSNASYVSFFGLEDTE